MTRLGLSLPYFHAFAVPEFVDVFRDAEARGYDTAWVGEVAGPDAVTVQALIASQTSRLRLATGVVPLQTRTPVVLGITAATLDRVAPGRVALGLGLSSRTIVEQWNGVPFARSLEQVREAVTVIRGVTSGERVTFEGRFYRIRNFRLAGPPPARPVRIYLAALGPAMLELAGEIADGVLLNWLSPETVPASIGHLEAGAKRGGRTLADFEIAAFVRTCVTDDPEPMRQALARDITGYAIVDVYARFFAASGFGEEVRALNAAWKAGDRAGAVGRVSPRMLDALGVVGPPEFCRQRIDAFARAGLTMPVIVPFAPDRDPRASLVRTVRTFP